MFKSILNDGGLRGDKAMMHPRGCALTRVLLWPVRTPLKHTVAGCKAALKQSKVVTRVVTEWISGWKPKHAGLSKAFFIGEQNRRSIKTVILLCTAAFDSGSKQWAEGRVQKSHLIPPYPPVHSIGPAQKYFLRFSPR